MADAASSKPAGPPANKPSRDETKAGREAAKEAKRAAKAAALAKKAAKEAGTAPAPGAPGAAPSTSAAAGGSVGAKQQAPATGGAAAGAASSAPSQPSSRPRSAAGPTASTAAQRGHQSSSSISQPIASTSTAPAAAAASTTTETVASAPRPPAFVPNVLGSISLFGNVTFPKVDPSSHLRTGLLKGTIHPSVLSLAVQLSTFQLVGSNARSIAILSALSDFIADYKTPPGAVLSRDLITKLGYQISHITAARPLGNAAGNTVRFLKYEISNSPVDWSEEEAKTHLLSRISHFIHDRILYASRTISSSVLSPKVKDGDVVLTFGRSSVVEATLLEAWENGVRFEVIVVDSRPLFEGKRLLSSLVATGIPCTYGLLTSLSDLISRSNLILLGTSSLLANGSLYARSGTASVAMMGSKRGTPVVVACETYKFSERIQLDMLHNNEAGDPAFLLAPTSSSSSGAAGSKIGGEETSLLTRAEWASSPSLSAVSLLYDITPAKYITAVASEVGLSSPLSIGVLLRDYKTLMFGSA